MSSSDNTAQHLQSMADRWAADLASQDPAPSGSDLAWQQDQVRGAYEDAAYLTDQPRGW